MFKQVTVEILFGVSLLCPFTETHRDVPALENVHYSGCPHTRAPIKFVSPWFLKVIGEVSTRQSPTVVP